MELTTFAMTVAVATPETPQWEQYDENQSHGHVEHAGNGEYGERSLGVADAAEDGCFEIV